MGSWLSIHVHGRATQGEMWYRLLGVSPVKGVIIFFIEHLSNKAHSYLSNIHVSKARNQVYYRFLHLDSEIIMVMILLILLPPLCLLAIYCFPTMYQQLCRPFTVVRSGLYGVLEQVFVSLWSVFPTSMATFAFCDCKVYNHAVWKFLKIPFSSPSLTLQRIASIMGLLLLEESWKTVDCRNIKLVHEWKNYNTAIGYVTMVFIPTRPLNLRVKVTLGTWSPGIQTWSVSVRRWDVGSFHWQSCLVRTFPWTGSNIRNCFGCGVPWGTRASDSALMWSKPLLQRAHLRNGFAWHLSAEEFILPEK